MDQCALAPAGLLKRLAAISAPNRRLGRQPDRHGTKYLGGEFLAHKRKQFLGQDFYENPKLFETAFEVRLEATVRYPEI